MISLSTCKIKFSLYWQLIRADKPIGTWLLLWPMLWALWIASKGTPEPKVLIIMVLGTWLTRSAGCIINDCFDKSFDRHVSRTESRPLARGALSSTEAISAAVVLLLLAFAAVLCLNWLTVGLSIVAVGLMLIYPYLKRVTYFPQMILGVAFSWSVPMAFAAQLHHVPFIAILLFIIAAIWPLIYDTLYAMVDREDDLKIGIKSTAIWLGQYDRVAIALLQLVWLLLLWSLNPILNLGFWYNISLIVCLGFCLYQQYLITDRKPEKCLNAFLNNHWVGATIFAGIFLSYLSQANT